LDAPVKERFVLLTTSVGQDTPWLGILRQSGRTNEPENGICLRAF
jgi:hypothetical protein